MYKPEVLSMFGIPNEFSNYPKKTCIFIDGLWMDRKEFIDAEYRVFIGGLEPRKIIDTIYKQQDLIDNSNKFDLILTSFEEVLSKVPNSKLFPFGSSWIKKDFNRIASNYELSFLCGPKNHPVNHPHHLPGHAFRHEVFDNISKIKNIPLKAMFSIDPNNKQYIFNTSQFSIIMENSVRDNYFTEKLIDCLITKTIPIYHGCSNIGDYFNKKGIITFSDLNDLLSKISMLNENIYKNKLDVIEENYQKALEYFDFHKRVDQIIQQKQINYNNIK